MKVNSIKCDYCDREMVVKSNYPHHWGLLLSPVDYKESSSDMIFDVMLYPPLDRDYHFCGLQCLASWVGNAECRKIAEGGEK